MFFTIALVIAVCGGAYLGYKRGASVAAAANVVKTDVAAIKKVV